MGKNDIRDEEKDLIRYLPETQAIHQITGPSQVQAVGINKIKKK